MSGLERMEALVDNPRGGAPVLLVCDHASNALPESFAGLGLSPAQLADHVAWDIGAHALARRLSTLLDAPLVAAPASRLIIDPNRAFDAPDLIPETAEGAPVSGNLNLGPEARRARIEAFHAPYHDAIDALLKARLDISAIVAIHSFTPIMFGEGRPWSAGILHGPDTRIADVLIDALSRDPGLTIGRNQPYAPEQGVFYTLDRHGRDRATAMIEVRNDLIRDEAGQENWARRLAGALESALEALLGADRTAAELGGRTTYAT